MRDWRDLALIAEIAKTLTWDEAQPLLNPEFDELITRAQRGIPIHADLQVVQAWLVKAVPAALGGRPD